MVVDVRGVQVANVKKAVIPAAGLGTRFLPATKAQPKEMLPIVDTPAIEYVVEEAVRSGIDDILIITGRGKRYSKIISIAMLNWNHSSLIAAKKKI